MVAKAVFSLNFSSAGKGPFKASKAKNVHQKCTFLGAGGSGVWDMTPPLLGNLGAKISETSFPLPPAQALRFFAFLSRERHLGTRQSFPHLKTFFYSNLPSIIYIYHFLVPCENRIRSQLGYFLKVFL